MVGDWLSSADKSQDFVSNLGVSLVLVFNQGVDVQFNEALALDELVDDSLANLHGVCITTWSHKENAWLDTSADLLEGLIEGLLSADGLEVGGR